MAELTYRETGVDLEAAMRTKRSLADVVAQTQGELTHGGPDGFGGVIGLPTHLKEPLLVSSTDGVGSKLCVAFATGRHDTVGRCLVNHCVNDILVQGARPLFFMDYLAVGTLDAQTVTDVVGGVADACRDNSMALLGGETAEMPDFYRPGEYDLAGFILGVVEADRLIDGSRVREGDMVVGLASSGLHTNGFTLARRIVFGEMGLSPDDVFPGTGRSVAEELLEVHSSYAQVLLPLVEQNGLLRALAHVTGGGIEGNLPRVLPKGLGARIRRGSWPVPTIFHVLAKGGGVARREMERVFNMGVGMLAVVAPADTVELIEAVRRCGVDAYTVGEVVAGEGVVYA